MGWSLAGDAVVPRTGTYPDSGWLVMPRAPNDSALAIATYHQRLLGRRAVYLLTTAREWGRPLESAVLEVEWSDYLGKPRFSLPFVQVGHERSHTLYRFEAAPFVPDTDLVVTW